MASGSSGVPRPSLADDVRETGAPRGATAAGGGECWLRSVRGATLARSLFRSHRGPFCFKSATLLSIYFRIRASGSAVEGQWQGCIAARPMKPDPDQTPRRPVEVDLLVERHGGGIVDHDAVDALPSGGEGVGRPPSPSGREESTGVRVCADSLGGQRSLAGSGKSFCVSNSLTERL